MRSFKKLLKNGLLALGVEARRRQPFGMDVYRDATRSLGGKPARTVFDVGANEGQTALAFVEEFPEARIFCFEPNPAAFTKLKQTVSAYPSVKPHPIALGAKTEMRPMHLTKSSLTSSLLPVAAGASEFLGNLVENAGDLEVEVRSLDDYLQQAGIEEIDLLKLDVQGFELELLEGARKTLNAQRIALILTEVCFVRMYDGQAYFQDIYGRLIEHGFRLVGLYQADYRSGPYMAWCDALFVNLEALKKRH